MSHLKARTQQHKSKEEAIRARGSCDYGDRAAANVFEDTSAGIDWEVNATDTSKATQERRGDARQRGHFRMPDASSADTMVEEALVRSSFAAWTREALEVVSS